MVIGRLKFKYSYLLLFLIIVLGSVFRFSNLFWGIERDGKIYITGPTFVQDENFTVFHTLKKSIDKNPHYFINPDLYYSLCYFTFMGLKKIGIIKINGNLAYQKNHAVMTNRIAYLYMLKLSRVWSLIFGILSVVILFFIAKELYNEKIGLISASLMSFSYLFVFYSKLAVVESAGVFLGLFLFYWAYCKEFSRRNLFVVSFILGIALSVKYLNIYLFLPFLWVLRKNHNKLELKDYFIGLGIFVVTFIIFNPYVALSFNQFLFGDERHFGGIFGSRGLLSYNNFSFSPFRFLILTIDSVGYLGFVMFIIGLFYAIRNRSENKNLYILLFLFVFYFTLLFNSTPHLRHILYALPFLFIIISYGIDNLIRIKKIVWFLSLFMIILFALSSLNLNKYLNMKDTRVMTDEWVLKNIRDGVKIGLSYNVVSQPRGFIVSYMNKYEVKYLKCRCDLLNQFRPDLFITTEDKLNPSYEPNSANRKKIKSFLKCLNSNYSIIKVFDAGHPKRWEPPLDIKYIVHPNVYVFQRRY